MTMSSMPSIILAVYMGHDHNLNTNLVVTNLINITVIVTYLKGYRQVGC